MHSALKLFKENVCDKNYQELQDEDYNSLAIGYFLSLGISIEDSLKLASEARYRYEYWTI